MYPGRDFTRPSHMGYNKCPTMFDADFNIN